MEREIGGRDRRGEIEGGEEGREQRELDRGKEESDWEKKGMDIWKRRADIDNGEGSGRERTHRELDEGERLVK